MKLAGIITASSIFILSSLTATAGRTPLKEKFDPEKIGTYTEDKLRIVGYDDYLQEYIFEASADYYKNITYQWSPNGIIGHDEIDESDIRTSRLTDRATDKYQIIAFLREVYTNPAIPGFRHDLYGDKYADEQGYIKFSDSAEELWVKREDYFEVKYEPADIYPYYIQENDVAAPIIGATALIVELTDNYSFEKSNDDVAGKYYESGMTQEKQMDNIFQYIKAISLMPTQLYIDSEQSKDNPGYIFNISAQLSKFFLITKGCNRAYKSYMRKGNYSTFRAGEPFYHMFEEYSPYNKGPQVNAFADMNDGRAFEVDHNCGTSIQQQHDIVLAPSKDDYSVYNINLMLFIPDRRFDGITTIHPDNQDIWDEIVKDGKELGNTLTPYTFYAKEHRPYIYFNKIQAAIGTSFFPMNADEFPGDGDDDTKPKDPAYALVPIQWVSQYNRIVGHQAVEAFTVYHVTHGNIESKPIPYSNIILRSTLNNGVTYTDDEKQANGAKGDGVTIYSYADTVFAYVVEPYNAELAGTEVSYIVKGHRDGSDDFIDVQSNTIVGHMPGNSITLNLVKAQSKGDFRRQVNHYTNTVQLVYNNYDFTTKEQKDEFNGNLLLSDILEFPEPGKLTSRDDLKPNLDAELHVYRMKMIEGMPRTLIGKFKFSKEDPLRFTSWGDGSDEKTALVVKMDAYKCILDENGEWLRDSILGNPDDPNYRSAFYAKRNYGTILTDGGNYNANLPLMAMDDSIGVFATFIDSYESVIADYEHLADRFRYYVCLVKPSDGDAEIPVPGINSRALQTELDNDRIVVKLSNYSNVYVPKRQIYAGYKPYTFDEIQNDLNRKLKPNGIGLAIHVLNNENVSGYEIYDNITDKLVARIDRYTDGHFVPSLYDSSGKAVEQTHNISPTNYNGKVIIDLPNEYTTDDQFTAEIHYYNSGMYAGNSYIMPRSYLPETPSPFISWFNVENVSENPNENGHYEYSCYAILDADMNGYIPVDYGIWYSIKDGDSFAENSNIYHPWNSEISAIADDAQRSYTYTLSHPLKASDNSDAIIKKDVRLYAAIPEDYNISTSDEPGYIIADTQKEYSLLAVTGLSGIESVIIEPSDDSRKAIYNLNGIRMDSENLLPGVYISQKGDKVEKILIK